MDDEREDSALAEDAAGGDAAAMTQLISRHYDYVYGICLRIVHDQATAEDLRQESFVKAARQIKNFRHMSSFRTWLHSIACNTSLNHLRAEQRAAHSVPEPPEDHRSVVDGPARFERSVDARIDIDAALERITPEYRDAIVLRYLCDLDYGGIADTLGIQIGTVRSRLSRGLDELREIFSGNMPTTNDVAVTS